jgi:hypothetical protein
MVLVIAIVARERHVLGRLVRFHAFVDVRELLGRDVERVHSGDGRPCFR